MAPKTNSFRSLIAASGQAVVETPSSPPETTPAGKPRTLGKRTSADYIQVGLYLPRQLHRKAKLALLEEGEERDFSELVRDLLAAHLNKSGL